MHSLTHQVANAAATTAQIGDLLRELGALRAEIQSCQCSTEAPTLMPTTMPTFMPTVTPTVMPSEGRRLSSYAPLYTLRNPSATSLQRLSFWFLFKERL